MDVTGTLDSYLVCHRLQVENIDHDIVVFADPAHGIKSQRNMFFNHKSITMSEKFRKKYNLKSGKIDWNVIKKLINYQSGKELKIAPHLKDHMLVLGTYSKMNVGIAKKILSRDTGAAIEWLVKHENWPETDLATAKFCNLHGYWYDILSERGTTGLAFSLKNEEKHTEVIEFLQEFMEFIGGLKYEKNQVGLKPVQKGILMSTTSIIWLQDFMLNKMKVDFFRAGKILGDAIESFHGDVRAINSNPTALNYKRYCKSLSVIQVMANLKRGRSYEEETSNFLTQLKDFRKLQEENMAQEDKEDEQLLEASYTENPSNISEAASLAYLGGYVLFKTICTKSKCQNCKKIYVSDHEDQPEEVNSLISFKEYKQGKLVTPSPVGNRLMEALESLFRTNREKFKRKKNQLTNISTLVIDQLTKDFPDLPKCHLSLIVTRFMKIRLLFWGDQITKELKAIHKKSLVTASYASKSTRAKTASQLK